MKRATIILALLCSSCLFTDMQQPYRERYVEAHSSLDASTRSHILRGTVKQGMTRDQVRASLGNPQSINTSSYGTEQWCYSWLYLYFENGVVSDWQQEVRCR